MSAGTLYLIPASLGDLKSDAPEDLLDWSIPAAVSQFAAGLTCFGAENAKSARALLKAIGLRQPIQSVDIVEFGHHPTDTALKPLVDKLLQGIDVGVLAEAGCPGIADPGAQLARLAHAAGIRVRPLTGPSSIMLALMASGLEGQRFAFAGYAPVKSPMREEFIKKLETRSAREGETQILIETPYRNDALWAALLTTLAPSTLLSRAVALTLPHEMVATHTVQQWRTRGKVDPSDAAENQRMEALVKLPTVFLFLAVGAAAASAPAQHGPRAADAKIRCVALD